MINTDNLSHCQVNGLLPKSFFAGVETFFINLRLYKSLPQKDILVDSKIFIYIIRP